MSETTPETHTTTFSKDEKELLLFVLKSAQDDETNVSVVADDIAETTGMAPVVAGGTDEFYSDPPTPAELTKNFEGQQWTGTRTEYEALQIVLTSFVTNMVSVGMDVSGKQDEIDGMFDKFEEAHLALGGGDL